MSILKGKYLAAVCVAGLMVAGCSGETETPANPTPSDQPTVTVTGTVAPPVTVTQGPRPTVTAKPKVTDCVQNGISADGWNMLRDTPTWQELILEETDPNRMPMVDAPLVDVRIWGGSCFDTVEFVINTNLNDWRHGDRPYFDVEYVDKVVTEGSGFEVPLIGDADLRVTVFARAAEYEFQHGVDVDAVNAFKYRRIPGSSLSVVKEVAGAGEQEGQFTFGIGIDQKRPFAAEFHGYPDGKTAVVIRVAHSV